MDSLAVGWFNIFCLIVAGCFQFGLLYIAFQMLRPCKAKAKELLEEQEEAKAKANDKPKADGYSYKEYNPKEKATANKDYKPGAYFDCEANTYKPLLKPVWVAEARKPKEGDGTSIYFFHLKGRQFTPNGLILGECYLYSGTGKCFVTTTDPKTALLIQQLLNDGNLTTNDINNKSTTNDLQ
jgi:hypothetical protein